MLVFCAENLYPFFSWIFSRLSTWMGCNKPNEQGNERKLRTTVYSASLFPLQCSKKRAANRTLKGGEGGIFNVLIA
jgi:hypothetical protein